MMGDDGLTSFAVEARCALPILRGGEDLGLGKGVSVTSCCGHRSRLPIKDLARQDRRVTPRAMTGVRGLLTIACLLLAAAPAAAGTLYGCAGADGARSDASKRVVGAKYAVVARSSPEPNRRWSPASVTPIT